MVGVRLRGPGRLGVAAALAVVALVLTGPPAWAPHVPQLEVTPSRMRPGDQVVVAGTRGFGFTHPVQVRFNSPDGPVLGTFQPDRQPYAAWGPAPITIPADTPPGTYTLYATQQLADLESHIRGVPARMTIEVIGPGGPPVVGRELLQPGEQGSTDLLRQEGPSWGALVIVGLGVAGLGIFLAAVAVVVGNRRRTAEMERVS